MSAHSYTHLFETYKLGDLTLKNRFVMASLTRSRADHKTMIPTERHVEYYSQRTSAGLILTECSPISPTAPSFSGPGGIYNKEQVEGWRKVTEAVHAKEGLIFLQIWHAGRSAHPSLTGVQPIGPSAIIIRESLHRNVPHVEPREMTKDDIKEILEQFRQGAMNAKEAGFDGIELHGANGYLIDEFLKDGTNHRTDEYGGSVENRVRFPLQVMDILIEVFGASRVGIKLSPVGRYQDMYDSDPFTLYRHFLTELDNRKIAYVQFREPEAKNHPLSQLPLGAEQIAEVAKTFRPYFNNGAVFINESLTPDTAEKAISEGTADLAVFGRYFISNPDFVARVKNGWPFNDWDVTTFYVPGDKGYIDYPVYNSGKPEECRVLPEEKACNKKKRELKLN